MSSHNSLAGSSFIVNPMESHTFSESKDEFLCQVCLKPRCFHYRDGFVPNHSPSGLSTDPACRYRGPHPRWTPPGKHIQLTPEEEKTISRNLQRKREQKQKMIQSRWSPQKELSIPERPQASPSSALSKEPQRLYALGNPPVTSVLAAVVQTPVGAQLNRETPIDRPLQLNQS